MEVHVVGGHTQLRKKTGRNHLTPAECCCDRGKSGLGVTHGHQVVAHVGVGSTVVLRQRCLAKDELHDAPEPRFRVDPEQRQRFPQVVEAVGGQFVEDTLDLPEDVLSPQLLVCWLAAARRLHPDAVELQTTALHTLSCLKADGSS